MSEPQLEPEVEIGGYDFELRTRPCLHYIYHRYDVTVMIDDGSCLAIDWTDDSGYLEFGPGDLQKIIKLGEKLKAFSEGSK